MIKIQGKSFVVSEIEWNASSWLFQEAAEHYQVTFATGVERRKVGSPFSLTLFLPWFWHFKLFVRLWGTSQPHKPTPKKFKDGANLLFYGLIVANKYASSMRSRGSYRFQIDSSYMCGQAKTMRKHYEWTRIFLKTGKRSYVFKRIRIRVDTQAAET